MIQKRPIPISDTPLLLLVIENRQTSWYSFVSAVLPKAFFGDEVIMYVYLGRMAVPSILFSSVI